MGISLRTQMLVAVIWGAHSTMRTIVLASIILELSPQPIRTGSLQAHQQAGISASTKFHASALGPQSPAAGCPYQWISISPRIHQTVQQATLGLIPAHQQGWHPPCKTGPGSQPAWCPLLPASAPTVQSPTTREGSSRSKYTAFVTRRICFSVQQDMT